MIKRPETHRGVEHAVGPRPEITRIGDDRVDPVGDPRLGDPPMGSRYELGTKVGEYDVMATLGEPNRIPPRSTAHVEDAGT